MIKTDFPQALENGLEPETVLTVSDNLSELELIEEQFEELRMRVKAIADRITPTARKLMTGRALSEESRSAWASLLEILEDRTSSTQNPLSDLAQSALEAGQEAQNFTHAQGSPYTIGKEGNIVQVHPDGREVVIGTY